VDPLTWLRFHVQVGISAFYFWLEDSPDLLPVLYGAAEDLGVAMYVEQAPLVDRGKEDNYADLMVRQSEFVDRMVAQAREDSVAWLFHTDDDELLLPRGEAATWPEVLMRQPDGCLSVHLSNWEGFSPAKPAGSWMTDPAVRYLPRSCASLFAAYANGKSVTRTSVGQRSHGPHYFTGGASCELQEADGLVLHHDALAMGPDDVPPEAWVRKYSLRKNADLSKIPFDATKEAVKVLRSGSLDAQRRVWLKFRSQTGSRFKACDSPQQLDLPSHHV